MTLFISSFFLGIAFCAPPGIVTAETVRRGIARGFFPALWVQVGSILGDLVWASIAMAGAALMFQNRLSELILSIIGAVLLLFLAYKGFLDFIKNPKMDLTQTSQSNDLTTGALLSLSNPFAIAFWAGASSTIFINVPGVPQWYHFALFFFAFFLGTLAWCFFLAALIAWGRQYVTSRFFRMINLLCSLALLFFAVQLGWEIIQLFT